MRNANNVCSEKLVNFELYLRIFNLNVEVDPGATDGRI